ncbi:Amino-transferase class IV [uncultured archaeon]|nr:Amino-transferase class IV [uncultured archaeon]
MANEKMPIPKEMKFWMNGKLVPESEAKIDLLTNTLHYGFGVFEGIRCYKTDKGPAVFRLCDHVKRLRNSWHAMGMELAYSQEDIEKAIAELINVNNMQECYVRPLIYLSGIAFDPYACKTNLAIACWVWNGFFGDMDEDQGIRAAVSSFCRPHVNASLTKAKITGTYYNSLLARGLARKQGYHEAIMLDSCGMVSEGTGDNIFIVRNNTIYTPARKGILEGITRDSIIAIAKELGHTVIECDITREELYIADEVFMTGTAAELECVSEIDNRKIGSGRIGPVTKKLRDIFREIVHGKSAKYDKWLYYVRGA